MKKWGYEEITDEVVLQFAKTLELFDLSTSEAHLFAYMYITNKPLTLDDMSEVMGKSKTTMSTTIRSLLSKNLVDQVWRKGVRKNLYQANHQLFRIFMHNYLDKWIETASHQKEALEDIKKHLPPRREKTDRIEERLNDIITFHEHIKKTFRMLG